MLGMVTTEAFLLETYLAAYAPKSLTASAWLNTRGEVLDLVRHLGPESEGEAKNLLGALTRYLGRMCPDAVADLSALTADGIDRFVALERAAGAKDSTLGQVTPRLRRLLRAREGKPAPKRVRRRAGSLPPFDAVTDGEWEALARCATAMAQEGKAALLGFLEVGEKCGFRPEGLAAGGWGPTEINDLRPVIETHHGLSLDLQRLRNRWLRGVMSVSEPLSTIVSRHGLTRRDLERAAQGFCTQDNSSALLRSA